MVENGGCELSYFWQRLYINNSLEQEKATMIVALRPEDSPLILTTSSSHTDETKPDVGVKSAGSILACA